MGYRRNINLINNLIVMAGGLKTTAETEKGAVKISDNPKIEQHIKLLNELAERRSSYFEGYTKNKNGLMYKDSTKILTDKTRSDNEMEWQSVKLRLKKALQPENVQEILSELHKADDKVVKSPQWQIMYRFYLSAGNYLLTMEANEAAERAEGVESTANHINNKTYEAKKQFDVISAYAENNNVDVQNPQKSLQDALKAIEKSEQPAPQPDKAKRNLEEAEKTVQAAKYVEEQKKDFESKYGKFLANREGMIKRNVLDVKPNTIAKDTIKQAGFIYSAKDFKKGVHINSREYNNMVNMLRVVKEWENPDMQKKLQGNKDAPKTLAEAMERLHSAANNYISAKDAQIRSNPSALRTSRYDFARAISEFALQGKDNIEKAEKANQKLEAARERVKEYQQKENKQPQLEDKGIERR